MNNDVVYAKMQSYGSPGYVGSTMDGKPVHRHYGAYMMCPRCTSPLVVAQEQVEHRENPHSVGHTGGRLDAVLAGETSRRCGAHFVTGDPETIGPAEARHRFVSLIGHPIGTIYQRPIMWHGDV